MKNKMNKKTAALILALLMLAPSLASCAPKSVSCPTGGDDEENTVGGSVKERDTDTDKNTGNTETDELPETGHEYKAEPLSDGELVSAEYTAVDSTVIADFSLKLLETSRKSGENTLLSPLSVMYALGMSAEGARGNTLTQMEDAFGTDKDSLADSLVSLRATFESKLNGDNKKYASIANSIWVKNSGFTPNADFIERNRRTYSADIFSADFDDSTKDDINYWVSWNTFGKIKDIVDEIPDNVVMYLVNTVYFECEWGEKYEEYSVREGDFTDADGNKTKVDMMHSDEHFYIEGDGFTGFIKPYEGGNYGFAAILPDEDKTVGDVLSSLDGGELVSLLSSPKTNGIVYAAMPKFTYDYDVELSSPLISLGMSDAFDKSFADFSGLGTADGNIYISRVLHKTHIEVAEGGTTAAAATAVEMVNESVALYENEWEVTLDRPFVYVIYETKDHTPLFVGTYEKP